MFTIFEKKLGDSKTRKSSWNTKRSTNKKESNYERKAQQRGHILKLKREYIIHRARFESLGFTLLSFLI
jgi:hypothetical protein